MSIAPARPSPVLEPPAREWKAFSAQLGDHSQSWLNTVLRRISEDRNWDAGSCPNPINLPTLEESPA
jgi:hypothetical protein